MKKITLLCIAVMTFAFSFQAKAQCDYTIELTDAWGDGWNGVSNMDVLVNGAVVLDDIGLAGGSIGSFTFTVNDGDDVTTIFNAAATSGSPDWAQECGFRILDALGNEVFITNYDDFGGPPADVTTGTITASCPACSVPDVSYNVVSNCPVDNGFSIEVVINDIGTASGVTITDDQGTAASAGLSAGTYTYGSYLNATQVVITVTNDSDGTCATSSASLTFGTDCPPVNDDFANALPIACDDNVTGSTVLATLDEATAPGGGGADVDAPNVWYSFDSAVEGAGDITLDLCPSTYDTSLLVYTGTSGNLTFVAGNDDNNAACGGCCQSNLTFQANGTDTYFISIEGYNAGNVGDYDLTVTCVAPTPPPANDLCGNAEPLALTVTTTGTTVGATQTGTQEQPTCDPFGVIADVWYSVDLTLSSNDLNIITAITDTSDQANVAVYPSCVADEASSLGCSEGNGGETLTINALPAGTYFIRVWSDGNAPAPPSSGVERTEGGFTITVDATLSVNSFENANAFTYYPNPVNNELQLRAQKDIQDVAVYNMLGQEVIRTAPNAVESTVDMNGLSQGAYFVQVTIDGVTETVRVVKR
ncbi:T9SS type A sorting domain-containing protein [Psychroserpens sp. BH13MA-6]